MYPPTHILAAVLWTTTKYPFQDPREKLRLWTVCALGSLVSDLPYALQICLNWAQGIEPGRYTEPVLWRSTQVAHVLLFWLVLYAELPRLLFGQKPSLAQYWYAQAFTVSGILHILVDSLTHGKDVGVPYFWPDTGWLVEQIGFWMYKGHVFRPQWEEIVIDLGLVLAVMLVQKYKAWVQTIQAADE